MKIRHLYLSLCFLCFVTGLEAQLYPKLKWQKFFGTSEEDKASSLAISYDAHIWMGGTTSREPGGCSNILIIRADTLGNELWRREIGGEGCEELRDIAITDDNGAIFVGINTSFIEHPEKGENGYRGDYFIGKLSSTGNIEWIKSFGGIDLDQAYGVVRSKSWEEYLVVGASASQNFDVETQLPLTNLWCIKIGEDGTKKTNWAFGGTKHDWAYDIAAFRNGDYVFAGYTNSENLDGTKSRANGDGWIGRIDRYGMLRWQKIYSGKFEDYFTSVIIDKLGRIVVVGNFESEQNAKQFWFLKLTGSGRKMYENIFGGSKDEYATAVIGCDDGGYLISGYSKYQELENRYIKGKEDFWLIRMNYKGEILWQDTYGGADNERGEDVVELRPGVYYALGSKENNFSSKQGNRKSDFWLLRVDEQACDPLETTVKLSVKNNEAAKEKNIKFQTNLPEMEGYIWDFGDGTTSTDAEPIKKYNDPGMYEVRVTIFITPNCSFTHTMPTPLRIW